MSNKFRVEKGSKSTNDQSELFEPRRQSEGDSKCLLSKLLTLSIPFDKRRTRKRRSTVRTILDAGKEL